MWSYYGAKTNIVDLYPKPKHDKIIEPFAGTARYSLKYFEKDVLLVDKYEVIVKIWKWLQLCSENDILKLPRLGPGQTLNDFDFDCEEAKLLMGFIVQFGVATPGLTPSATKINPGSHSRGNFINYAIRRISKNLFKIRHWKIIQSSYDLIDNETATWFIDPPYQTGGHKYKHSNKDIDFTELADYCSSRKGQVIVCENSKADWMPFVHLKRHQCQKGLKSETIWSNETTAYDMQQQKLFI